MSQSLRERVMRLAALVDEEKKLQEQRRDIECLRVKPDIFFDPEPTHPGDRTGFVEPQPPPGGWQPKPCWKWRVTVDGDDPWEGPKGSPQAGARRRRVVRRLHERARRGRHPGTCNHGAWKLNTIRGEVEVWEK